MFTLSVALIIKNEEATLSRILSCAKKFADEIIVVDTGSTDNSVKIALEFTEKVYFFGWRDDFAAARNYSFSMATCEYVMWLDADDYISWQNIKKIKRLKERGGADIYTCAYKTAFDENGNCVFEFYRERIIKNCKVKWQGFIHEAIPLFGKIVKTDIAIEHRKVVSGDKKRNLKIYRRHLKNGEVLSKRDYYYYARELYYNRYYLSAIRVLEKIIEEGGLYPPDLRDALMILSDCYIAVKKYKKAVYKLNNGLFLINPNSKYYCKIGESFKCLEMFGVATAFYEKAVESGFDGGGFYEREYSDFIPFMELCFLHFKLGDIKKSYEYHLKAKALNAKNPSVLYNERFFSTVTTVKN